MYQMEPGCISFKAVKYALNNNYIHFDTAEYYQNEADLCNALKSVNIPREKIFITSKIFQTKNGREVCIETLKKCLENIQTGYIDQYLLHAPQGGKVLECYDALLELQQQGLIKTVGVSNFGVKHLEALKNSGRPLPAVNQIELHPWCTNEDIVEYCRNNNITVVGFSPLTKGRMLDDKQLKEISKSYDKSPAQILIRWSIQKGFVTIPKSIRPECITENANVFDFCLTVDDMNMLDSFGRKEKIVTGWDPTNNEMAEFGPVF
jgi:diketogulonate reductase-like aldo/keto reductase